MAVEVKPRQTQALKASQAAVMEVLAAHGIPCFRWDPDVGLVPISTPLSPTDSSGSST